MSTLYDSRPFPQYPERPGATVSSVLQQIEIDRALAVGMQLTTEQQVLVFHAGQLALSNTGGTDTRSLPPQFVDDLVRLQVLVAVPRGHQLTPFGATVLIGLTLRLALQMQGGRW